MKLNNIHVIVIMKIWLFRFFFLHKDRIVENVSA